MKFRIATATLLTALLGFGCDDGDGGNDNPTPQDATVFGRDDGGGGAGGSGGTGGAGGTGGGTGETVTRLLYTQWVGSQVDLMLYDFKERAELNLTKGSSVDCLKGCAVSADMRWIAWLEESDDRLKRILRVAEIDVVRKQIREETTREVAPDVQRFAFSGDLLVYSTGEAEREGRNIDVLTEPITGCGAEADCPQLVGEISPMGDFRVADEGQVVVLLDVSLSAMTVYLYNAANGLSQVIDTFGEEGFAGSPYDGRQPVGIAPDQSYLWAFTSENFEWKAEQLQLRPNPPPRTQISLFPVATAPTGSCDRQMPLNFTTIAFNPLFSHDSEHAYFLATGDCSRRNQETNRPDSDILRLHRNATGSAQVENVTQNLRVSHWSNHQIDSFALSPDSQQIAFVAPRPNDAQSRSIWLIDTDSRAFDCSRSDGELDLENVRRCEFISNPEGPGTIYRDLRFVTVDL